MSNDQHIFVGGSTGKGKTRSVLIPIGRARLKNPLSGFVWVDPEGELTDEFASFIANPANDLGWRKAHILKPASRTETFGLPLNKPHEKTPEGCHLSTVRTMAVLEQAVNFGIAEYGPRLSKLCYIGCFGLAATDRPLVCLPEILAQGASHIREIIGDALPYQFMSEEWRSWDALAPKQFIEYRDPLISRLLPVFGNPPLRRVFGVEKCIDFAHVKAARHCVGLDLSDLEHKDAVLVGNAFNSCVYHEMLRCAPHASPEMMWMIDEVADFLQPDLARSFDRLRKRGVRLCVAAQRRTQLLGAGDADAAVMNAVISGCGNRFILGTNDPDDAEYFARMMFTGHLNLEAWKENSKRPSAVGLRKIMLSNWGESDSEAVAEAEAQTRGTSRTRGHVESSMHGLGSALGSVTGSGAGEVTQMNGGIVAPLPVGVTAQTTSSNEGQHSTTNEFDAHGESDMDMESAIEATTLSHSTARANSRSRGGSEGYITEYRDLESSMWSLPEQMHRAVGLIMRLERGEVLLKVGGASPILAHIRLPEPAFKSPEFKRSMLPIFLRAASLASPYIISVKNADFEIAARVNKCVRPEPQVIEPDISVREQVPFAPPLHPAPPGPDLLQREPLPAVKELREILADVEAAKSHPDPEPPPPKPTKPTKPKRPSKRGKPRLVFTNPNPQARKPHDPSTL